MMEYPLRLEIAQFHELRLRGRSRETDPAWLALLAIILACVSFSRPWMHAPLIRRQVTNVWDLAFHQSDSAVAI